MMWSPYTIKIVLHHHCSEAPFENESAPAYQGHIEHLVHIGVLCCEDGKTLKTTPLGEALVKLWCNTPLPVQVFVDPRFNGGADAQR